MKISYDYGCNIFEKQPYIMNNEDLLVYTIFSNGVYYFLTHNMFINLHIFMSYIP